MLFLKDLVKGNGHKLVRFDEAKEHHNYTTVFEYSSNYGGTFDSHRYYNDYVIEL